MYQNDPKKILTGEGICSYPNLFKPQASQDGDPEKARYGMTILIPKTDQNTYSDILNTINYVKDEALKNEWKGIAPNDLRIPLYDGDGTTPQGMPFGEECKGHWVIRMKSKRKPQVVHISNLGTDLLESDVYAGMKCRVTFNVYAYQGATGKGISFGLGNVLKTGEGTPLSGGAASASSDFAGLEQAAPAPTQGMINPLTGLPM